MRTEVNRPTYCFRRRRDTEENFSKREYKATTKNHLCKSYLNFFFKIFATFGGFEDNEPYETLIKTKTRKITTHDKWFKKFSKELED